VGGRAGDIGGCRGCRVAPADSKVRDKRFHLGFRPGNTGKGVFLG